MRNAPMAARAGLMVLAMVLVGACSATRTQESAGEVVDDSAVTAKVKTALMADPVTEAREIKVETYRGVVQLAGFVGSAAEKTKAGEVARSVSGVKEVRNDLHVSSAEGSVGQVIDDGVITTEVKAKLIEDPTTKAYQINVDTKGGVVALSGFVDSSASKSRAGELAKGVKGVTSVRNDLEIRQK